MTQFTEQWLGYSITYDETRGDRTLVVDFPGAHELIGPAGTLIGLLDLADRVVDAIDSETETYVASSFRWPPSGFFASQTFRARQDGALVRYLKRDWNDPDQVWSATIYWGMSGQNWYSSASMGAPLWRSLRPALRKLFERERVRAREENSAMPAT